MTTRNKLVAVAASYVGFNEKDGSHKKIIDLYNKIRPLPRGYNVKYTDDWCATFVSAVASESGALDIIPAECSCEKMIDGFKKLGTWEEKDNIVPPVGAIIFYDWGDTGSGDNKGWSDHVGIVESVDARNGNIIVIEGNNADGVRRRNIAVDGRYIRGYGLPSYSSDEPAPNAPAPKPKYPQAVEQAIDTIARSVINGGWGVGQTRKDNLYAAIQGRVNEILSK